MSNHQNRAETKDSYKLASGLAEDLATIQRIYSIEFDYQEILRQQQQDQVRQRFPLLAEISLAGKRSRP